MILIGILIGILIIMVLSGIALIFIVARETKLISGGGEIILGSTEDIENSQNAIISHYSEKYPVFAEWKEAFTEGGKNENLEPFFVNYGAPKTALKVNVGIMRNYIIYGKEIGDYFNFQEKLNGVRFFDIGFAPGGMSYYLLEYCGATGEGLTLDPDIGGNPISNEIKKFAEEGVYNYKIIDLFSLSMADMLDISRIGFSPEYDFVIFDASQHIDAHDATALNNLQIIMCFSMLKNGGSMLTRLGMDTITGIRKLAFLVDYFNDYSGFKPVIKFGYKKSYYAFFEGFKKSKFKILHHSLSVYETFPEDFIIGGDITGGEVMEKSDKIMKIWREPMITHTIILRELIDGKKLANISNRENSPKSEDEIVSVYLDVLKKYNLPIKLIKKKIR